jgi:tetratricopeptide (TPR) repeat protein
MRKNPPAWALFLLFCLAGRAFCNSDMVEIRLDGGERAQLIGQILAETWQQGVRIQYERQGEKRVRTIPLQVIEKVRRAGRPSGLSQGLSALQSRKFQSALQLLGETYKELQGQEDGESSWAIPYVLYHAGQAAAGEAKYARVVPEEKREYYAKAAELYGKLLESFGEHRLAPDAALGRAVALMWLGRHAEAERALQDIAAKDYPPLVKARAQVWQGRLMAERDKPGEAIEILQNLREQHMQDQPELAYLAVLCAGYAWQKKGGIEAQRKAEELFRQVGLHSPSEEMRAEALNSRGTSLRSRGDRREALLSFLRVVVLHPEVRHEYQRALYEAADLSEQYYGNDRRARELRDTLRSRFPDSYWTKKLEEQP